MFTAQAKANATIPLNKLASLLIEKMAETKRPGDRAFINIMWVIDSVGRWSIATIAAATESPITVTALKRCISLLGGEVSMQLH